MGMLRQLPLYDSQEAIRLAIRAALLPKTESQTYANVYVHIFIVLCPFRFVNYLRIAVF